MGREPMCPSSAEETGDTRKQTWRLSRSQKNEISSESGNLPTQCSSGYPKDSDFRPLALLPVGHHLEKTRDARK